jgi:hypothetical protein
VFPFGADGAVPNGPKAVPCPKCLVCPFWGQNVARFLAKRLIAKGSARDSKLLLQKQHGMYVRPNTDAFRWGGGG